MAIIVKRKEHDENIYSQKFLENKSNIKLNFRKTKLLEYINNYRFYKNNNQPKKKIRKPTNNKQNKKKFFLDDNKFIFNNEYINIFKNTIDKNIRSNYKRYNIRYNRFLKLCEYNLLKYRRYFQIKNIHKKNIYSHIKMLYQNH